MMENSRTIVLSMYFGLPVSASSLRMDRTVAAAFRFRAMTGVRIS